MSFYQNLPTSNVITSTKNCNRLKLKSNVGMALLKANIDKSGRDDQHIVCGTSLCSLFFVVMCRYISLLGSDDDQ